MRHLWGVSSVYRCFGLGSRWSSTPNRSQSKPLQLLLWLQFRAPLPASSPTAVKISRCSWSLGVCEGTLFRGNLLRAGEPCLGVAPLLSSLMGTWQTRGPLGICDVDVGTQTSSAGANQESGRDGGTFFTFPSVKCVHSSLVRIGGCFGERPIYWLSIWEPPSSQTGFLEMKSGFNKPLTLSPTVRQG